MKLFLVLLTMTYSTFVLGFEVGDCLNATTVSQEIDRKSVEQEEIREQNYRGIASIESLTTPLYSQYCCKVCNYGKACGNTCISQSKRCSKIGGCACDR